MDQISTHPKCRLFLKLTSKGTGTWQQVFICLRPRYPPPHYILYEYIPLYLFTQGRGGGQVNQCEG
jgi:hypothetical protein